jgi:hypothetical protein
MGWWGCWETRQCDEIGAPHLKPHFNLPPNTPIFSPFPYARILAYPSGPGSV